MTSCKLFERTDSYCLGPSRIGKTLRKHQSLQKNNITYLSLNRFFRLTTAKIVPESQNQVSEMKVSEFQNQAFEKMVLQHKEGLVW